MSLESIEVRNFKSIKYCLINIKKTTCLLGENGSGKTTIFKAIECFHHLLTNDHLESDMFDRENPYNDYFEISLKYDLTYLKQKLEDYDLFTNDFDSEVFTHIRDLLSFAKNGELQLKVRKYKNNSVEWVPNLSRKTRVFLKNTFPVYFVSGRNLNLHDWESLWEIIADLSKVQSVNLNQGIENFLIDDNFNESLKIIKQEIEANNFEIKKLGLNEQFIKALQLHLNGSQFKYKYESLQYYSDGINSLNYYKLMLTLVSAISRDKIKHPFIVLDEPEIGIHPQNIDELMSVIQSENRKPDLLLNTHSPRIIKHLMKDNSYRNVIYQVTMKRNYSYFREMKKPNDLRETFKITDQEAGYYFAKGIIFVEGDTEIELLSNKRVCDLFPFIKNVDVFPFDSNTTKLNIVHPDKKNINIPYLIIVDFDQIVDINNQNQMLLKSRSKEHLNPLKDSDFERREKFLYGKARVRRTQLRNRINSIMGASTFTFDNNFHYAFGDTYYMLQELIKNYCLEYNVYPVKSTIEGSLVNYGNVSVFRDWLIHEGNDGTTVNNIYNYRTSNLYKVTVNRIIVGGKFDNLKTKKNVFKNVSNYPSHIQNIYNYIKDLNSYGKTSGWVSRWIDYIFDNYIEVNNNSKEEQKELFSFYFQEIYDIIKSIEKSVVSKIE